MDRLSRFSPLVIDIAICQQHAVSSAAELLARCPGRARSGWPGAEHRLSAGRSCEAVTLEQALEKADRLFDEAAATNLANTETLLKHHGASAEELAIELARLKEQHAADRRRVLETVVALFHCWSPHGEIWEAEPSPWIH
jgi:hypothetical protein